MIRMSKTSFSKIARKRNIAFAFFVLVILIVSIVAYQDIHPLTNESSKLDFKLSLSASNVTLKQGESTQVNISATLTNDDGSSDFSLTTKSNSSIIECNVQPAIVKANSTSTLTINVPPSTPTGYYQVIVTASSGNINQTAFCSIAVLSSKVIVYGGISSNPFNSINPIKIEFKDVNTGSITVASVSAGVDYTGAYSVSLDNEHSFSVTYYFEVPPRDYFPSYLQHISTSSTDLGTLTVYAGVGNTTQIKNFTYL